MKANRIALCAALLAGAAALAWQSGTEERVSARIGIQVISGDQVRRAKTDDRLTTGDRLRIHISPNFDSHIYVVHADEHKVTLLHNGDTLTKAAHRLMLPSETEFFEIDGNSSREKLTILCSPKALDDVSTLLASPEAMVAQWSALEKVLLQRSRIDLHEETEKPFAIAGNVRGEAADNAFAAALPSYAGNSLVVKRYQFRVEE